MASVTLNPAVGKTVVVPDTEIELNQPGFAVTREHIEEMEQRVKERSARADAVVSSGGVAARAAIEALPSRVRIEERGEVNTT